LLVKRREFITLLGGTGVWPLAARAQQPDRVRRVGFLISTAETDQEARAWITAFERRFAELGWVDGRNVRIEYRFGEGNATRMPQLAKELLELRPDAVLAATFSAATAMRQQTLSIPIVFVMVADAVSAGFVTNLARPEGNITGITNFEFSIGGKWLQVIKECAPAVSSVAVIFDPANPTWAPYLRTVEAAAPTFGMQLTPAGVTNAADIDRDITAFSRKPNGAIVVIPAPVTVLHRDKIIAMAAQHRLPAVYPYRFYALSGGLVSYGVDLLESYRRAASYVDRILKGAKPADLPVELPTKFELVINLKTAKALGITVPPTLLSTASEVIE
jgi:putative tryptophan/tyrosine transport system substrate-binding protein